MRRCTKPLDTKMVIINQCVHSSFSTIKEKLDSKLWILVGSYHWLAGVASILNHVWKKRLTTLQDAVLFAKYVSSHLLCNRFSTESCSAESLFTDRNSLDQPVSSGEAVACQAAPVRRWRWHTTICRRRRIDWWPFQPFQSRFSTWAHYSRINPWLAHGNKRQWMIEKRLNWWSGNIFNAHCSEKSVKFGRKLYLPLLHSCSCAAGGFIQRCVRCLLTIAARRRWRKAAKMEEMAERDVHSSPYNALSARRASGNRSVITFFLHKLRSS